MVSIYENMVLHFLIICAINLFLYNKKIINNWDIIVYIPFLNFVFSFLFISIPCAIYSRLDFDYIEKYYPEISKKIWIYSKFI